MSICKIGETKVICGRLYVKSRAKCDEHCHCIGCDFDGDNGCIIWGLGHRDSQKPIEEGGRECSGTIWILADDQTEAPTAKPPRDEVREQRRFTAAVAAMQGMLSIGGHDAYRDDLARFSVYHADALLAELDRTVAGT